MSMKSRHLSCFSGSGSPERRHCSRNPKWGPSDFGCEKLGDGHGLRRPAFVLRPSRRRTPLVAYAPSLSCAPPWRSAPVPLGHRPRPCAREDRTYWAGSAARRDHDTTRKADHPGPGSKGLGSGSRNAGRRSLLRARTAGSRAGGRAIPPARVHPARESVRRGVPVGSRMGRMRARASI